MEDGRRSPSELPLTLPYRPCAFLRADAAGVKLPGLTNYGVASYCAAIGAALASLGPAALALSPPPPPPPSAAAAGLLSSPDAVAAAASSVAAVDALGSDEAGGEPPVVAVPAGVSLAGCGMSNDDWIDLLCSVADMLDGGSDGLAGRNGDQTAAAAAAAAVCGADTCGSHERPHSLEDLVGYFETWDGNHRRQPKQQDQEGDEAGSWGLLQRMEDLPPGIDVGEQEEEEEEEEEEWEADQEEGCCEGARPRRQQKSRPEPTPAVTVTAVIINRPAHTAAVQGAASGHAATARHHGGAATAANRLVATAGAAPVVAPSRSAAAPVLSRLACWRGRRSSVTARPPSLSQGRNSCTGLGKQQQQQSSLQPPAAGAPCGAVGESASYNALACCSGNSSRRRNPLNPQSARRLSIIGMRALLATRGSGCYSAYSGSGAVCTTGGNATATAAQASPGFPGSWDAAAAPAGGRAGVTDAEFLLLQQMQRWDSLSCGGEWLDEYIYEDGDPCSPAFSIPLPVPPLHQLHHPTVGAPPGGPRSPQPQQPLLPDQQQHEQYEDDVQEHLASLQVMASPRGRPGAATGRGLSGAGIAAGLCHGHGLGFGFGRVSCVMPLTAQAVATQHVALTADEQETAVAAAMAAPAALAAPLPHVRRRAPAAAGAGGGAHMPLGQGIALGSACGRCGRSCGGGACCFAGSVDSSGYPALALSPAAMQLQVQLAARSLPPASVPALEPARALTAPLATCSAPPMAPQAGSPPAGGPPRVPAAAAAAAMAAPEVAWPPPAFRALRIKAVRDDSGRRASHLESLSTAAHPPIDFGSGIVVGVSHDDGTSGYGRLCRNVSTAPAWWAYGLRRADQVGVFG